MLELINKFSRISGYKFIIEKIVSTHKENSIWYVIWKDLNNNGQVGFFLTSNDDSAFIKGSQYSLRLTNTDIMLSWSGTK